MARSLRIISEIIAQASLQAASAPHGGKTAIYEAACKQIGCSMAQFYRYRDQLTVQPERKQRSDAGQTALSYDEAVLIAAAITESMRANKKRTLSLRQAIEILRNTDAEKYRISASRTDPVTGEITLLSDAAIARALRHYGLHPDQLGRPAPYMPLKSLYPNHVWQIDASLCVLYYLSNASGMQVMESKKFYKNKPQNVRRIENMRVWSYEVTDHYSGSIFVNYVLGAESAQNIADSFIKAIQQRGSEPFYGVPEILMMDKGSANTSGRFNNLLRRLGVKALPHAAENARATGQVEKARDIIERQFESMLRMVPVHSLDELNKMASVWALHFNSRQIHSRSGQTRFAVWQTIKPEQLRIAPEPEYCQALMTHDALERQVREDLTILFNGHVYNVRGLDYSVGETLMITYSPYKPECASIVERDAQGNEVLRDIPEIGYDQAGFRLDANVIGKDYRKAPVTPADINRAQVEQVAMAAANQDEVQRKRKSKALLFNGEVNPLAGIQQQNAPLFMPRAGTALEQTTSVQSLQPAPRILNHFEAARELVDLGVELNPQRNALIKSLYPQGVPDDELPKLKERLQIFGQLRIVQAGGA